VSALPVSAVSKSAQIFFYADDFTGATDTLATAARAGLRTVLFLGVPNDAQRARVGALDCLGIAGAARSMGNDAMRAELAPVAALAKRLAPRVLHYKTCSTFDSAPEVGSIGVAVDALRGAASQTWIAIVGGQPNLGRYCLFGNLFAAAGSGGEVFRIDRHPTMSVHPVTPMHEADLRRHLALQGLGDIALVPWTRYDEGAVALGERVDESLASRPDAVLWDIATPAHLEVVGRQLWARSAEGTLLAAGPSSVVQAVATQCAGVPPIDAVVAPAVGPVLVLAGSLSPVTAGQVAAATSFDTVWLDPAALAATDPTLRSRAAGDIAERLACGRHVLACTVQPHERSAGPRPGVDARALAQAGGALLADVLARVPLRRIGVAGGDTSSLAVQALDAWGLSYLALLGSGAALCRLHSDSALLDGMEILLKGGQMGPVDLFERLVHGTRSAQ